jgi:hypothetical protein
MWQGWFVLIMLYEHIGGLLFYLRDLIFVCKILMKGSRNLSTNVNVTKNLGRPSCWIIVKKNFVNFQNN